MHLLQLQQSLALAPFSAAIKINQIKNQLENIKGKKSIKKPNDIKIPPFVEVISKLIIQKWSIEITLLIEDFRLDTIALINSGADSNYIQEGLIPTKFFEKIKEKLTIASGSDLKIKYKLSNALRCNNNVYVKIPFILVKDLNQRVILGTPFLNMIKSFYIDEEGIKAKFLGQVLLFQFIHLSFYKTLQLLKDSSINLIQRK